MRRRNRFLSNNPHYFFKRNLHTQSERPRRSLSEAFVVSNATVEIRIYLTRTDPARRIATGRDAAGLGHVDDGRDPVVPLLLDVGSIHRPTDAVDGVALVVDVSQAVVRQ